MAWTQYNLMAKVSTLNFQMPIDSNSSCHFRSIRFNSSFFSKHFLLATVKAQLYLWFFFLLPAPVFHCNFLCSLLFQSLPLISWYSFTEIEIYLWYGSYLNCFILFNLYIRWLWSWVLDLSIKSWAFYLKVSFKSVLWQVGHLNLGKGESKRE